MPACAAFAQVGALEHYESPGLCKKGNTRAILRVRTSAVSKQDVLSTLLAQDTLASVNFHFLIIFLDIFVSDAVLSPQQEEHIEKEVSLPDDARKGLSPC